MTRRSFLKVSVAGGLALSVGLFVGQRLRWGRYAVPKEVRLRILSPKEYRVLSAAALRILDGVVPAAYDPAVGPGFGPAVGGTGQGGGSIDVGGGRGGIDVAQWIDGYLGNLDRALSDDVRGLLQVLEHSPLLLGEASLFTALDAAGQDRVLLDWERSRLDLRRQGMQALKSMCCLAYYQDPRSFAAIGYSGPMLP